MNHLSYSDIRERVESLLSGTTNTTADSNIQLMVMVYIQLSATFGDIDSHTAREMIKEYVLNTMEKK